MLWYCIEIVLLIYFPLYYHKEVFKTIQNNSLLLGNILSTTDLVSLEKPRYQGVFFSFSFSFSTRCWSQEAKSGFEQKLASFGPKDSIIVQLCWTLYVRAQAEPRGEAHGEHPQPVNTPKQKANCQFFCRF